MIFKEKSNPYKIIFGRVYRALFKILPQKIYWDILPESRKSKNKFQKLKNQYQGEKAVILFNGPSLLKSDFSLLKGSYIIGLNKINLLFNNIDFTPNLIVAFDELLNNQNSDFLKNSPDLLKIINYKSYKDIRHSGDDLIYLYNIVDESFCYDPSSSLSDRGATPYFAFQIAYYMGFKEIAIIGADHNFPNIKPLAVVKNEEEDKFHFHKDYHKKGQKNQYPDKIKLDMIFRDAKLAFEEKGRKIFNATEGGSLEIFDRIKLQDFVKVDVKNK